MNEEKFLIKMLEDCQDTHIEDIKVTKLQYTTEEAKVILDLINRQQKEIEDIKKVGFYNTGFDKGVESVENRIKEKLEEIRKQYNNILSSDNVSLEFKNINSHRFDAMSQVLEELLKGI